MQFLATVAIATVLVSMTTGKLSIGKHYTSGQGGDYSYEINEAQNLGTVDAVKSSDGTVDPVNFDNTLSRYKIDGDETWEFYDGKDYIGKPLFVVTGPIGWTWIKKELNDIVSSVKQPGPVIRLSGEQDVQGGAGSCGVLLTGGLQILGADNRDAGTLSIGKHYTSGQGGDYSYEINEAQNLGPVGAVRSTDGQIDVVNFDNTLSRYKIDGDETWEFYDGKDYIGKPLFVVTGPIGWTRVEGKFNDKVSSVKQAGGPVIRYCN